MKVFKRCSLLSCARRKRENCIQMSNSPNSAPKMVHFWTLAIPVMELKTAANQFTFQVHAHAQMHRWYHLQHEQQCVQGRIYEKMAIYILPLLPWNAPILPPNGPFFNCYKTYHVGDQMTLLAILCMKKRQDCQKMPHCRLSAPKIAHFWTLEKTDLVDVDSYKPVHISGSCTDNITGSKKQGVQVKEIRPMLILFNDPQDLPRHKNDITALVSNHHLTCSGVQLPA